LFQTVSQTEKASFQLFNVLLICSVTKLTFDHSDKTKVQLFGSGPKQWNLLEEVVVRHSNVQLSGWLPTVLK